MLSELYYIVIPIYSIRGSPASCWLIHKHLLMRKSVNCIFRLESRLWYCVLQITGNNASYNQVHIYKNELPCNFENLLRSKDTTVFKRIETNILWEKITKWQSSFICHMVINPWEMCIFNPFRLNSIQTLLDSNVK